MRLGVAAALAALVWPGVAQAEDGKLDVSLQIRLRAEAIDGQFRPNIVPSDAVLLVRTLLAAEYDAGPVRIGGELLDGRAYFERRRSSIGTTEVNTVEPIQAYLATDVSDAFKLVAGRFTLDLGSRRLIARNQFRNTINTYNGAHAVIGERARNATLFWFVPQRRLPDDAEGIRENDVRLDTARGSPRVWGAFLADHAGTGAGSRTIEAYAIRVAEADGDGVQTRNRRLWTAGGRLLRRPAPGRLDFELEAATQWGRARRSTAAADIADRPVEAWLVDARVGYMARHAWKPRVSIAFDFATGDDGGDTYGRFDPLFSARSFDYGPTSLLGAATRSNLVSAELRGEAQPGPRTDLHAAVRPMWLARRTDAFGVTGVRDASGRSGRFAGVQYDARVRQTLVPDRLRMAVGAALIDKGRFLRDAPNAPDTGDTHYGYVELTASF